MDDHIIDKVGTKTNDRQPLDLPRGVVVLMEFWILWYYGINYPI